MKLCHAQLLCDMGLREPLVEQVDDVVRRGICAAGVRFMREVMPRILSRIATVL